MQKIVECVPNFSEGRRPEVVDAIVKALTSVNNVYLLDHEMDADHNRAVITIVVATTAIVGATGGAPATAPTRTRSRAGAVSRRR